MAFAKDVTVVPADQTMVVNGEGRKFLYAHPDNLHAIQWHDGKGSVEYTDGTTVLYFDVSQYNTFVAPYVEAFNNYVAKQKEDHEHLINSVEYKAESIRNRRDWLLNDCQWIVDRQRDQISAGIPTMLNDEEFQAWLDYRQNLRDITAKEGFPWNGAEDSNVPWPKEPTVR